MGSAYLGYNLGYTDSFQKIDSELQRQIKINSNIIDENEALIKELKNATNMNTVKIGYIATNTTDLNRAKPFIEQIVKPDLNEYAKKLGYNVTFQFEIRNAQDMDDVHLQALQELKKLGVDLVISGGWSSMISSSLSYVNDRDMLLICITSTSPSGLSTQNDNVFRMIPNISANPNSLASIMWSYGIKSVITIQSGDTYGDGFVKLFKPAWIAKGGNFAGDVIRYAVDATDFTAYLQTANTQAQIAVQEYSNGDRVGILLVSEDEDGLIISEMENFSPLKDCVVFIGDYNDASTKIDVLVGNQQMYYQKVFTISAQQGQSSIIKRLSEKYPSAVIYLDGPGAYLYDSSWAIATAVLETRSVNASAVAKVFPDICGRLYGASGWCKLDQVGDRIPLPLDLWFYHQSSRFLAGIYNPDGDTMTWNSSELGYAPEGP